MALIPDNLRSVDYFELLIGLGAGPLEGFNTSMKASVHLDDTPLENYEDINATFYEGTAMGTTVPLKFGGQASNNSLGILLETGAAVSRRGTSVSPASVRIIEVRLLFSALYHYNEQVGQQETTCEIKLEYKRSDASSWTEVDTYKISGKTTSNYVKEYRFKVPSSTVNYDVRVTKLSPSETDAATTAVVYWESFQEVVPVDPTYSNLAMLHVVGRGSNQLRGVPSIWSDLKLKKVRVPTSYDPVAKTYNSGIWDGTFKTALAYTTNPIWNLYDVATDPINGVASYYNINLDKFSAYQVAQWCDEMVADGAGGTQPRFTLNTIFHEPTGAKELLRYLAGLCATTYFDDGDGNAFLRADISTDPVALFTPENVIDGEFAYSYTDITTRHNDITVEFINPQLGWQVDRRRVFDQTSIDQIGRVPHDFTAIGCIDDKEAVRRARHHMVTSIREKQMVSFKTNRLGLALAPYDVFLIGDPKVGYSVTGRMLSANGTVLTLRDPVTLEAAHTYIAKFQIPNPNYPSTESNVQSIIERSVTSASPGVGVTELTLSSALPSAIAENAVFTLESTHLFGTPKRFRMLGVKETEGSADIVEVMGIEVYTNKWAEILGEAYTDIKYSVFNPFAAPPAPTGLDLSIKFRVQGTISKPYLVGRILGNLVPTSSYRVSYRRDGGARTIIEVDEPYFEIEDIPSGLYTFEIRAVSKTGKLSSAFTRNFSVKENLRGPNAPRFVALISDTGSLTEFDLFPIIEWTRGADDAFIEKYIITIKDTSDTLINTYETPGNITRFSYDLEKLQADSPDRMFKMCVSASQTVRDPVSGNDFKQLSAESCITVSNPRPVLTGMMVNPKLVGSEIIVDPVAAKDYLRMVVWASESETFTPSSANMVYSGVSTSYHHVHYSNLWFKAAVLDSYDPTDYTISSSIQGIPKLLGYEAGGLSPFSDIVKPIVIVATIAERDAFLAYTDRSKIPPFVYVTGDTPPTLYEYNTATHMYQDLIGTGMGGATADIITKARAAVADAVAAALRSETAANASEGDATAAAGSATVSEQEATASENSASASASSATAAAASSATAQTSAEASAASSVVASTKAGESGSSAAAAKLDAVNAKTDAAEAKASSVAAASSETDAEDSAAEALVSQTAAAMSEADSQTSAEASAASSLTASTKATEAGVSQAAALVSQTAAAMSETDSQTSAEASAASSLTASTKATEAGVSQAAALISQEAAAASEADSQTSAEASAASSLTAH